MDPLFAHDLLQTRRQFFGHTGLRFGGLALASMLGRANGANATSVATERVHPALANLPHFAPKAKRLIYLHMNGGPSQLDLFDYKPQLAEQFDKDLPDSIRNGQRITTMTSGQTRSMATAARGSANCSRKPPRSWTTSPSSKRSTPPPSITIRPAPSS
jgi:hypothetical protein